MRKCSQRIKEGLEELSLCIALVSHLDLVSGWRASELHQYLESTLTPAKREFGAALHRFAENCQVFCRRSAGDISFRGQ